MGGEVENSGSVFLKFWREKKIQELPRTMSQNSVGEEVENSGRVFERLEKKFKGLPRTTPFRGGWWKIRQRVFEILERKKKSSPTADT